MAMGKFGPLRVSVLLMKVSSVLTPLNRKIVMFSTCKNAYRSQSCMTRGGVLKVRGAKKGSRTVSHYSSKVWHQF